MSDDLSGNTGRKPIPRRVKIIIGVVLGVLALLCCGIGGPVVVADKTKTGWEIEHGLTRSFDDNRNKLAECLNNAVIAAGYTKEQAKQMTDALIAARNGANTGPLMGTSATPAGFSAIIVQQMPELAQYAAAFERGFKETVNCRKEFHQQQGYLNGKVEAYKNWKSNPFNLAKYFGPSWPSDELTANNGKDVAKGAVAFERISNIITSTGANKSFQDGTNDADDPFATQPPPSPGAVPSGVPSPR